MLKLAISLASGLFLLSAAHAQVDQRLVGPTLQALQAQLSYMQALAKVQHDDDEARMATLWQWLIDAKPAEPKAEAK